MCQLTHFRCWPSLLLDWSSPFFKVSVTSGDFQADPATRDLSNPSTSIPNRSLVPGAWGRGESEIAKFFHMPLVRSLAQEGDSALTAFPLEDSPIFFNHPLE